jgi:hypothetical protein
MDSMKIVSQRQGLADLIMARLLAGMISQRNWIDKASRLLLE